jgi:hypothetical protein
MVCLHSRRDGGRVWGRRRPAEAPVDGEDKQKTLVKPDQTGDRPSALESCLVRPSPRSMEPRQASLAMELGFEMDNGG